MNDLDLYKSLKTISESSDCRILAIDGKAVLAEKFSSSQQSAPQQNSEPSYSRAFFVGAIAIFFVLGVIAGIQFQAKRSAAAIQLLQAEKLILEGKITKIRDLVNQP